MSKLCQRCNRVKAVVGEKFCKRCRASVLAELGDKGYFQNITEPRRTSECRGRSSRDLRIIADDFGRDHYEEEE